MKITSRKKHAFTELKVDEVETTIFASSEKEVSDTIQNLFSVIDDLSEYTGKSLIELAKENGYQ